MQNEAKNRLENIVFSLSKLELHQDMVYWRKKICNTIFYAFSFFGFLIYIPSTILAFRDGFFFIAILNSIVYIACLFITFNKQINYISRAIIGSSIFYILGVLLMFTIGPGGTGGYWLFTITIISALMLGNPGAISASIITSATMIFFYFLIRLNLLDWAVSHNFTSTSWLIKTINYIFLNAVIVIANAIFIRGFSAILSGTTETRNASIIGLAKLAEYRDADTGEHLYRIQTFTVLLGKELAKNPTYKGYITNDYLKDLQLSSILHDIGKVGIHDSILQKPGSLTTEEFDEIKQHPIIGCNVINEIEKKISGRSLYVLGREIALYHHEKWDGSGYPKGLEGRDIPLSARIIALVDVYDALTSERCYKTAMSHDEAVDIILKGRGTHFDPEIVDAFLHISGNFIRLPEQFIS